MNTKKLNKHHSNFYKYYTKFFAVIGDRTKKIKIYEKLLKTINKLKYYEYLGKVKYKTSLNEVAEIIEDEKNRIL